MSEQLSLLFSFWLPSVNSPLYMADSLSRKTGTRVNKTAAKASPAHAERDFAELPLATIVNSNSIIHLSQQPS